MTLNTWTRRNARAAAATPAPALDSNESAYAAAWGLTDEQWSAATVEARRDMRDRVVFAPNFNTTPARG